MNIILPLLYAGGGSFGFTLLFHIKDRKDLAISFLSGAIVWAIYLIAQHFRLSIFVSNMIAAFSGTIFSEITCRIRKCPATLITVPSVLPLIPGGILFSAMQALVRGQTNAAGALGLEAVTIAAAIAGGIYIGSLIFRILPIMKTKAVSSK